MVDHRFVVPVLAVLGRSSGLCERSCVPMLAVLVRSWGLMCWQSRVLLGPMLAVLGCSWAYVGGLGPLLGLCGRSWSGLGVYVGAWAALECPRAVLGRSWDLS